jgi:arylsulfatase A-like enzyme
MKDYYAAISGIDEHFQILMNELKKQGILDHTIVVLTADHGELMGAHGLMAKHSWHEESIGVPLMIRWPQGLKAGQSDIVLNTVDMMPTLLGLMGQDVPEQVEGTNFAALLRPLQGSDKNANDKVLVQKANEAYISAYPGTKEAMDAFAQAGLDNRAYGWRSVRTKQYSYVVHKGYAPGESVQRLLYDLVNDPYQMNPLALQTAEENPLAAHFEEKLGIWLGSIHDPFELG